VTCELLLIATAATLPVGVSKSSGWGRHNGSHGLEEFLELRTITVTDAEEFTAGMKAAGITF
jgi:acyl-CoA reductase-like NAD-dependent aldehyde dehydrogenase